MKSDKTPYPPRYGKRPWAKAKMLRPSFNVSTRSAAVDPLLAASAGARGGLCGMNLSSLGT